MPHTILASHAVVESTVTPALVSLDDIRAAANRIRTVAVRTPLLDVRGLGLKCENFQPSGAFKIRGACNMLAQLGPEARSAGVITYSSGNHGLSVALVARAMNMHAVIVMPEHAPRVKVTTTATTRAGMISAGQVRSLRSKIRRAAVPTVTSISSPEYVIQCPSRPWTRRAVRREGN